METDDDEQGRLICLLLEMNPSVLLMIVFLVFLTIVSNRAFYVTDLREEILKMRQTELSGSGTWEDIPKSLEREYQTFSSDQR
ncbi:hypothetical protein CROQUDRAFT_102454 [Cronartium quercuum f. sp. fusiforme G11]|uniref:Uncharacterized protein n=1 Tax=Cronartium quercuum f. sp. fusiforme G11 TaxID=708437 RepID=A0A9P6N4S3_9BASI|nr:hypothetical protein CROQUDRAFT_102454 [Cronartium quercuum f. sp. fusiforme G11]